MAQATSTSKRYSSSFCFPALALFLLCPRRPRLLRLGCSPRAPSLFSLSHALRVCECECVSVSRACAAVLASDREAEGRPRRHGRGLGHGAARAGPAAMLLHPQQRNPCPHLACPVLHSSRALFPLSVFSSLGAGAVGTVSASQIEACGCFSFFSAQSQSFSTAAEKSAKSCRSAKS